MDTYQEFQQALAQQTNRQQQAQHEAVRLRNEILVLEGELEAAILEGDEKQIKDIRLQIQKKEAELKERTQVITAFNQPVKALNAVLERGKVGGLAKQVMKENSANLKQLQEHYNERRECLEELKREFLREVRAAGEIVAAAEILRRQMDQAKKYTGQGTLYSPEIVTGIVEAGTNANTGPIFVTVNESWTAFKGEK